MNSDRWLKREISAGLAALVALGLEGQPSAETIDKTADIWLLAVKRSGCTIEEIDAKRIREGFSRLFPGLRRWPAPAELIDVIPARPIRKSLSEPPPSKEECEAGKRALKDLQKGIEDKFKMPGKKKVDEEERRRQLHEQAFKLREGNHE